MTSAGQAAASPAIRERSSKVVNFVPEELAAPFFLRCASAIIDYMLIMSVPVLALLYNRYFGDTGTTYSAGTLVWMVGIILWVVNFLLLPLLRGQTLGKMLTGITILKTDGSDVRLEGLLRRNVFGYLMTAATLGLGFVSLVFSKKGRALHDLIGGTVVVRGRKTQL